MYPYNLQVPHFSSLLYHLSYMLENIQANRQPAFVDSKVARLRRTGAVVTTGVRLGMLHSGKAVVVRDTLLSWNETVRSVLKPCLRPCPRSLRMLVFSCTEIVNLQVVNASNQAER
jgi:hypothetical protein